MAQQNVEQGTLREPGDDGIQTEIEHTAFQNLRWEAYRVLGLGFFGLAVALPLFAGLIGADLAHIAISLFVYGAISGAIIFGLRLHLPHIRFGPANRLSLLRGLIIAVLAGFAWNTPATQNVEWIVCILAICALVLDGLDGAVARRSGITSGLGARLDCELDGLLTLILSFGVYLSGRVDAFILLAGAMHYAFFAARLLKLVPVVELPSSFRRQTAGVVSSFLLVLCCAPSMGASVDTALALTAVLLLTSSFAIDLAALIRTKEPALR